jgi:2-oxoglutarate ferredoxin oxidoreductase subunit alpha
VPGTPGLEHRIGGLEKADLTGNVSYDPVNHERMVEVRAAKVEGIAKDIPPLEVFGPRTAICSSSAGAAPTAPSQAREKARGGPRRGPCAPAPPQPLPSDLGDLLQRYKTVLVPEMNLGQLSRLLRERFLVDASSRSTRCRASRSRCPRSTIASSTTVPEGR